MATIVQPYNPWREQLAASILGPLVGNMIQKGQEAEQNRKSNAFLSELQNRMNAVQEPLTGQWISTLPDIFSKNDFTLGFDKDLRPWANSFFDNGNLPQMNMNATAAAPSALRADQIRAMAYQILGTNRFSMLDPQKARNLVDPYLQEAEKARREGQLADIAGSFTGAADDAARRNALWSGAIQGLVDPSMLGTFQKQIEADRPQPFSANLGGSWLFGNRDPNTGAITPNAQFPVTMTPYQREQLELERDRNARGWAEFNRPQGTTVYGGDGTLYNVNPYEGTAKPYVTADGSPLKINPKEGAKGQGSLSDVDENSLKSIRENKKRLTDELAALNDYTTVVDEEDNPDLKLANEARRVELQKQIDEADYQEYLIGIRSDPDNAYLRSIAKNRGWPMPEELASSNFVTDGTKTNDGVLFPGDTVVSGDVRPQGRTPTAQSVTRAEYDAMCAKYGKEAVDAEMKRNGVPIPG